MVGSAEGAVEVLAREVARSALVPGEPPTANPEATGSVPLSQKGRIKDGRDPSWLAAEQTVGWAASGLACLGATPWHRRT